MAPWRVDWLLAAALLHMIWQRSAWMFWQVLVMTVADGWGHA
jgi:hypothetical protein